MSLKRKLSEYESAARDTLARLPFDSSLLFPTSERTHKAHIGATLSSNDVHTQGSHPIESSSWRLMGDRAIPASLPLANMIITIQELIDPDFDPVIEDVDMDDACQFLKPVPSHIAPDDVEYLRSKNALTVPEPSLLNELLRAYFQWSYNFMPVLNIQDFLPAIVNNDPDANISLLLLQAVMFAGSAFADMSHLRAAGFQTRREARKEFFTRARVSIREENYGVARLTTSSFYTTWNTKTILYVSSRRVYY